MKVEMIHGLPCRQQDEAVDSWDILLLKDGVPTGGVVMSGTRAWIEQCIAGTQAEVISASMAAAPVGSVPYGERLPVPDTVAVEPAEQPTAFEKRIVHKGPVPDDRPIGKRTKKLVPEPDATTATVAETTAVATVEPAVPAEEAEPYYSAPVARPTKEPKAEFPAVLIDAACDITEFASTDSTRFVLNGIHFTEGYVEATDGRKLIRVPYPALDVKEFPEVTGACDVMKNAIVPSKVVTDALKTVWKKAVLAVLHCAKVGMNGKLKLATTDLDSPRVIESKAVDGQWPNSQQVIPNDAPKFAIALAPEHLMAFCKHAMKHAPEGHSSMKFEFVDDLSPVRITYRVGNKADNRQAFGVLMPMRMS